MFLSFSLFFFLCKVSIFPTTMLWAWLSEFELPILCVHEYELPSQFDFFVYVCNIIVILFVMFFGGLYFFSIFFPVRSIGHTVWGFFSLGEEIGNYKLFSFSSLLFTDQQKTTKMKKRGREKERE